jgi:Zn-finger nucleic acid-binding protein
VQPASRVDRERLQKLLEEEAPPWPARVRYLKCPTCRQPMHRQSYGARAGIIVDRCHQHGVWLDGGELRHILKWTKHGGEALERARRSAEHRSAAERALNARLNAESVLRSSIWEGTDPWTAANVVEMMADFLTSMLGRR